MLTQQPWVDRCLSAHSGEEALALVARYRPHVALVDLFIGEESGAEICEQLREAEPLTRVLLFSGAGEISPHAARAAGASGFAYKDWPARKIASAVRIVGLGKTVFDHQDRPVALGLSDRERDVLNLMASGATNPEIAEQLHLSKHTVKEHTSAVYRKLGRSQPDRGGAARRSGWACCRSLGQVDVYLALRGAHAGRGAERDRAFPRGAGAVRRAGARGARRARGADRDRVLRGGRGDPHRGRRAGHVPARDPLGRGRHHPRRPAARHARHRRHVRPRRDAVAGSRRGSRRGPPRTRSATGSR